MNLEPWQWALAGRWIIQRINQQWFELTALVLTFAAGLKLFFG